MLHALRKRLGSVGADEAVGVVLRRQEQKLDAAGVLRKRQGGQHGFACRPAASRITVEAEHHRIGKPEQFLHMVCRAGRAQRGHRVGKAQLGQCHHVHVALGHQGITGGAYGCAGLEQAIQLAAFAEHRGFRAVEVFGFALVQHTPAKTDGFALDVADGKHDAVAEAVVAFRLAAGRMFLRMGRVTGLATVC